MKRTALVILLFFLVHKLAFSISPVDGNDSNEYLQIGKIYVVLGVFSFEKNAIRYNEVVKEALGSSEIAYHPVKKWHYVYTGVTFDEMQSALTLVREIRVNPEFEEAWAYKVEYYEIPTDQSIDMELKESVASESREQAEIGDRSEVDEIAGRRVSGDVVDGKVYLNDPTKVEGAKGETDIPLGQKMYFNTFKSKNFKEVDGQVEIVDPTRVRTMGMRETHQLVYVENKNSTGDLQVICDIFGYKKMQHDFNMKEPVNERTEAFIEMKGDTIVVDFELIRYTKGDLVSMFNVYFFNNSAILKEESKYQLERLTDMLEENNKYKIGIYGNTNGSAAGPIIRLPEGSTEFFNLDAGKEGFGSAKKLSKERAMVIRNYLISLGIDEGRIKAKGYGGKKPLYDKLDSRAYRNLRVDIEILEDQ